MKTTIEITDSLLEEAKEFAHRESTTLRNLVEAGLARVLHDRDQARDFRLRDGSVEGGGLQPEFRTAGWDQIRDAVYEGAHSAGRQAE